MIKSYMGDNIKRFRTQKEMTQSDLAKRLGISRPTISSWEINRTEPSIQEVHMMASIFGCTEDELIGDYKQRLIRDHQLQRIMAYAERLSDEDRKMIIHQMEYLADRDKEANSNGKI